MLQTQCTVPKVEKDKFMDRQNSSVYPDLPDSFHWLGAYRQFCIP